METSGTRRLAWLVATTVGLLLMRQIGVGQTESSYTLLPVLPGARAAAFADAVVGESADATNLYWNPASLVYLPGYLPSLSFAEAQPTERRSFGITLPFQIHRGEALGVGFIVDRIGNIEFPGGKSISATQLGYTVAYAREIIPTFGVGAGVNVSYNYAGDMHSWRSSAFFGAFYSPVQELSYGAVLHGVGTTSQYILVGSQMSDYAVNLPRSLELGASLRFPPGISRTEFTLALANEKIFGVAGIRYNGGAELVLFRYVAFRGGYVVEPDLGYARFGLGIQMNRFHLDCAISPSRASNQAVQFTSMILW